MLLKRLKYQVPVPYSIRGQICASITREKTRKSRRAKNGSRSRNRREYTISREKERGGGVGEGEEVE